MDSANIGFFCIVGTSVAFIAAKLLGRLAVMVIIRGVT